MEGFEIETTCTGGGTAHTHRITVEHGPAVYGASNPSNVRLQYTCPLSREALIVTFKPPTGAGRPFTIAKVD
jgi:hypothetical protein